MDELQAAVLGSKLSYLRGWNLERQRLAGYYQALKIPSIAKEPTNWHLYPIAVKDPDRVIQKLQGKGIPASRHYPYTLPEIHDDDAPGQAEARRIARGHITIPMGPGYTFDEAKLVAREAKKYVYT